MRNLEIKAKVKDIRTLRNIAAKIGAAPGGKDRQTDTYFNVHKGRLKLRESALGANELIAYFRPDMAEAATSEYECMRTTDALRLKRLLENTLGIKAVVVKERERYRIGKVIINLDDVEGLGSFIEFEVEMGEESEKEAVNPEEIIKEMIDLFGIKDEDLVESSYSDMILEARDG